MLLNHKRAIEFLIDAVPSDGLTDSVIDGETGILVGPGDPAELARGILQLLRDRPMAREFGRRGRRLMLEKFTLRRTVEDEHLLYQAL